MKVVYIDGAFDLLHPGHIAVFNECKKYGDYLIVGLLSDENIESYKRKPILNLEQRYIMLNNIKIINNVIKDCPFCNIPEEFINKYNINKVIYCGSDLDEKWTGHYKIPIKNNMMINIPYDKNNSNISTSKIIKKIQSIVIKG